MANGGWLKFHRKLADHWCASDPNFFAVWFRLLAEANYEDKISLINGSTINVKRGHLIYGREAFSKRSGVSVSKLRRIMKVLAKEHMIDQQITNKYSIVSITNYDKYQSLDQPKTSKRPTNDQQTTTPKELKEVKKKKTKAKKFDGEFPKEWIDYALQNGVSSRTTAIQKENFIEYWTEGKGKNEERENWKLSWNTWIRRLDEYNPDYEPEDQNREAWKAKLNAYEKGTWIDQWGCKPSINGWKQSDHGEVPADLEARFIQISTHNNAGDRSQC